MSRRLLACLCFVLVVSSASTAVAVNVTGTPGKDTLIGTAESDRLTGRGGNDVLRGGAGDDLLAGDKGNDRLFGGPGRDTLLGGAGNDTISSRDGFVDTIVCGKGQDRVIADLVDHVAGDCEKVQREKAKKAKPKRVRRG